MLPWLLGTALSLLVSIGLVIHGFATGHPGWALANFFLWVTQPFYVMLHVGENNVGVRVVVLLLVLAPLAIVTFAARSLFGVIQALAA